MTVKTTAAPVAEPVTRTEAKAQCRIDGSDDDTLVDRLVIAARSYIEAITGLVLVQRTMTKTFDRFPLGSAGMSLPIVPVQSISSVSYLDADGAAQTLSADVYKGDFPDDWFPRVTLKQDQSWPTTRCEASAVTVTVTAGFAPSDDSPADYAANVPQDLKHAILMLVGHWYENRETVLVGVVDKPMAMAVDALVAPHKVRFYDETC